MIYEKRIVFFDLIEAHNYSERFAHYGPSEVKHVEEFDKGKYILAQYDDLDYQWEMSEGYYRLFGIINDNEIAKIEIILNDDLVLTETEFYDDLFLITCIQRKKHLLIKISAHTVMRAS